MLKLYINIFIIIVLSTIPAIFGNEDTRYIKENLGPNINTKCNEIIPVISPDGRLIYFSRSGDASANSNSGLCKDYDIFYSEMNNDGTWSPARNIGPPLSNRGNNYVCSVTGDGNTLILGGTYTSDTTIDENVSISFRTSIGWSYPSLLNIKNYYNLNKFVSFFLSSDGKTLLMSIEREDGYGDKDLYVSFNIGDNDFTEPVNLGMTINTTSNEGTPFLAPDGVSLFFSSNGHKGFGESDIFFSRRLDDTWQNWSQPQNLGKYYNTNEVDAGFYVSAYSDYAYLVSNHDSYGQNDIFKIRVNPDFLTNPVVIFSGDIINPYENKPMDARVYYEDTMEKVITGQARTDPKNGEFKILLPTNHEYRLVAIADSLISENKFITVTKFDTTTELAINFKMVSLAEYSERRIVPDNLDLIPTDILQKFIFDKKTIFFDFKKYPINRPFFPDLDYVAQILEKYPFFTLDIVGHADSIGSDDYNQRLSMLRANEVGEYLKNKTQLKDRINIFSVGSNFPKVSNSSEAGRAVNRRVEMRITRNGYFQQ